VEIRWNYGGTGGDGLDNKDEVDIELFTIEMVYVPQGSFKVGSGGSESGSFTNGSWASGNTIPLQITSESAITIAASSGNLWGTSTSGFNSIGGSGTLPADFPKGYNAFYCMKHEITQAQYVDFLNHLDRTQQEANLQYDYKETASQAYVMVGHSPFHTMVDRNAIRCDLPLPAEGQITFYCDLNADGDGNDSDDGYNVACNYLLRDYFLAYLDWAALRPMTELEYEKACRGPVRALSPTANEYAWGESSIYGGFYSLKTGSGSATEDIWRTTSPDYNALYSKTSPASLTGPFRVGLFASSTTSRTEAGASYWGILDLTGNLREYVVTIGHSDGRAFTDDHGDGSLDASGQAESSWPSADGMGLRGGSYSSSTFIASANDLRISSRNFAVGQGAGNRNWNGGRGVRTAP
jgi:formylglycine-generating enzyme required for sulfatase activity